VARRTSAGVERGVTEVSEVSYAGRRLSRVQSLAHFQEGLGVTHENCKLNVPRTTLAPLMTEHVSPVSSQWDLDYCLSRGSDMNQEGAFHAPGSILGDCAEP
jgi:hypothetical protein